MRVSVRTPLTVIAAVALCASAVSCSDGDGTSAKGGDGSLVTCTDFTDPPFAYVDGERQAGFDPDFLRAAAPLMKVSLQMKDTRFSSLLSALQAGRCNAVVSFLYVTPKRAETVDFVPYAESGSGFVVVGDKGYSPQDTADMCGHKVAVLQGGFQEQLASGEVSTACEKSGKPVEVRSFPTDVAAVQDLVAGRVDAFFADNATATFRAKEFTKDDLVVSNDRLLHPVVAGIAVRKGEKAWTEKFAHAIDELESSGELDRLYQTYGLGPVTDADFQKALQGS